MPLVSIVIPTYNRASFLKRCLDSIRNQTFNDYEILVVDDGSTDATPELIRIASEQDPRIIYLQKENGGPSAARNFGVRRARGEYIAFLDSDDYWLPEKLERQMALLRANPLLDVVYTHNFIENHDGRIEPPTRPQMTMDELHRRLIYENVIDGSASSILLKKSCFEAAGFFDESLKGYEDMDLWRRLAKTKTFSKVESPLVVLFQHPDQGHRNVSFMVEEGIKYLQKVEIEEDDCPTDVCHLTRQIYYRILRDGRNGRGYWRVYLENARKLRQLRPQARLYTYYFPIYYLYRRMRGQFRKVAM